MIPVEGWLCDQSLVVWLRPFNSQAMWPRTVNLPKNHNSSPNKEKKHELRLELTEAHFIALWESDNKIPLTLEK